VFDDVVELFEMVTSKETYTNPPATAEKIERFVQQVPNVTLVVRSRYIGWQKVARHCIVARRDKGVSFYSAVLTSNQNFTHRAPFGWSDNERRNGARPRIVANSATAGQVRQAFLKLLGLHALETVPHVAVLATVLR